MRNEANKTVSKLLYGPSYDPYDGLILMPYNPHGWASFGEALQVAVDEVKPKLIVEVGVWMGASVRHMVGVARAYEPDVEVLAVDTFLGSVEHWTKESYLMTLKNGRPTIYEQFLSNIVHQKMDDNVTPFPCDSINAFETLKKLKVQPDMIYIDAGHDYESVHADLARWSTLLRPGGILVGDDFHHPPIIEAVNNFFGPGKFDTINEKYVWRKK